VQRLGTAVESTLTAAAVIGREFRFTLLRAVTDLPDDQLLDALDAALNGRLLDETEDGYCFHHSLIRQTLYDALSRARRTWLHGRTGEAIEASGTAQSDSGQPLAEALAFHYERSDRRDRALPYLLQAGQKAASVYALEIAISYYEQALALMNDLGRDDPAQRWQILEQLGSWALIIANTAQAVSYLEAALALSPTDDWQPTIDDRVRLHRMISRTLISAGQAAEAEDHLQAAMELAADSGLVSIDYAKLLYEVAMWYWHRNEYQEAYDVAQLSLEVGMRLDNVKAIANAYEMLALCCHSLGEWQQGLDFEKKRAALVGSDLDVTVAYDVHL
jgi:predicted ATPase